MLVNFPHFLFLIIPDDIVLDLFLDVLEVYTLFDLIIANAVQNIVVLWLEIFRDVKVLAIRFYSPCFEDVGVNLSFVIDEHAFGL